MRFYCTIWIFLMCILCTQLLHAQDTTTFKQMGKWSNKLFEQVEKKSARISERMERQQRKYMEAFIRQEMKIRHKLHRKDSTAAALIFNDSEKLYGNSMDIAHAGTATNKLSSVKTYNPYMDSLSTAINFLKQQGNNSAVGLKLNELDQRFGQTTQCAEFLKERKNYLEEQLSKYNMGKSLDRYKKHLYYYKAQMKEYQCVFEDRSKLETKVLSLLQESTLYKDFFRNNSQLAGLFKLPGADIADPAVALQGLQARADIQQVLLQRLGTRELPQQVQQQLAAAQSALKLLKEQAQNLAGQKKELEMPDFKPNNQKTKSFVDRLEYGVNIQSTRTSRLLPATSDIAASLGYKLNDKSVIGFAASYKMGWGNNIRNIQITHQGIGLRTFAEYKLKGSFWMAGGGEMNYRHAFKNLEALDNYSLWQQSALLGVSKKYAISKKVKGNFQLLYDFLHRQQNPNTQPVVFRVGYTF